ncbi:MAG TPA: FadR/GntR family transcriptional regulator [Mesorhizobium sp.]|jgi:DNA-binding FadR family transcriptional regulator|nr:FadR/GntR family transcriptional regulator [Mesorhizobium sp.]
MSEGGQRPQPTLVDKTVGEIGRAIIAGFHAPGSTLPVENDVAARLGVGRNVVREAVKILAAKRLLRPGRRAGTTVLPREEWNRLDEDVIAWSLEREDLRDELLDELTALRFMVEPEVAALAAQVGTTTEVLRLFEAVELMERHANGPRAEAIEADILFHRRMFEASHNGILLGVMRLVFALLRANFASAIERDDGRHYYVEEHRKVADAVHRRDADGARDAMRALLRNNARNIDETRQARRPKKTAA